MDQKILDKYLTEESSSLLRSAITNLQYYSKDALDAFDSKNNQLVLQIVKRLKGYIERIEKEIKKGG